MDMHLFREIVESDIEDVYRLAMEAHSGITSLPKNRRMIEEKIQCALSKKGLFFFGLENLEQKKLIGVSAIKSATRSKHPFNHYKIVKEERPVFEKLKGKTSSTSLLIPEKEAQSFSELSSLFLLRTERHAGIGRLLSLSRFLFIKLNRTLFDKELKASLRGVFDERDRSPFWEHVGAKFVNISYDDFIELVLEDPSLILSVIPRFPPTLELLHPEARSVIGIAHKNTEPAKHLLEDQGMYFDNEIDLLDGGPFVKGEIDSLKPIMHAERAVVSAIRPIETKADTIIAATEPPFRSVIASLDKENGIAIDPHTAAALSLEIGSSVLYLNYSKGGRS